MIELRHRGSIPGWRSLQEVGGAGRVASCGGSEKMGLTAAGKPGRECASPWRVSEAGRVWT